jgi:hypothetical protein
MLGGIIGYRGFHDPSVSRGRAFALMAGAGRRGHSPYPARGLMIDIPIYRVFAFKRQHRPNRLLEGMSAFESGWTRTPQPRPAQTRWLGRKRSDPSRKRRRRAMLAME